VLIEFKKDEALVKTEKEKFVRYDEAKDMLSLRDGHHFIIFGQESPETPPRLELCCRTYFSGRRRNLYGVLRSGQQFSEFKAYVDQYIKFKKEARPSGGSGLTMEDFALVAGVNADNNIVESLSLSEFQRQRGLDLKLERHLERNQSRGYDYNGLSR
jgi:hypothetical protein